MEATEFIWIGSIILGLTLLGWLVLDWLESAQQWDDEQFNPQVGTTTGLGRAEQRTPAPLDAEMELMLTYPLDPFAPSLLWRPQPQDEWIEAQEVVEGNTPLEQAPSYNTSKAS
jgi:hypothetical protein